MTEIAAYDTSAAPNPMTIALTTLTKPAAGVMAASPAMAPDAAPSNVTLPKRTYSMSIYISKAVAAEVFVTINAEVASCPAARADPALKPNQPNQRSPAPMME